jgi:hypothetical protein
LKFPSCSKVIHDQKNKPFGIATFITLCPNLIQRELHPPVLHAIGTPRRMIQEIGDAAEMTVLSGGIANLSNALGSGTKDDAMN